METSSKQEHAERPAEAGQAATTKDAFHVDTHLIPQATLDEQGSSELQELGLSVFNQDVFEQGIMEQVDQALEKEEETRLRNILMKEMKAINDDIIIAKKDLERVNKAEADAEAVSDKTRDVARQLESIRRQKENKVKQLRTLQVRRENVKKKLARFDQRVKTADAEEGEDDAVDAAFQVGGRAKKETERERMIRSGEMTPFGTVVRTASSKASTSKSHPVHLSEFEKTLMTADSRGEKIKKDFKKYMKKKTADMKKPKPREDHAENSDNVTSESKTTTRKTNRFDERDWRTYDKEPDYSRYPKRARHHFPQSLGDASGGSEEDDHYREAEEELIEDDDGDETWSGWRQSEEETTDDEFHDEVDEEEDGTGKGNLKRKLQGRRHGSHRKKPRPLPKYRENSDDEAPVRTKVKRDLSIRRERDDADPEWYQERLLRQQRADEKKEKMQEEVSESEGDSSETEFDGGFRVPKQLWKKLFKYQKTGVRWLWELHTQQVGGIVGDEMGLGKTIQTISFLAALRTSKVRNVNFPYKGLGPTIIVCPTTVMHQWLKECHKWWPDFRVAILHSSGSFCGSESDLVRSIAKSFGILITSYNTLVIHQELVLRFNWHYVILDEGHKIRNPDAKVTLCCKQFRTPHRIILSGSPIQNNLKELWSLFDFVFPGKLGTLPDFMQHFAIPIVQGGYSNATQMQVETAYRCACVLRDTINPYLIRRMKVDVKKNLDLPSKNEQVLFCRLTDEQREVYQEYLSSRECNAILQGKFQVFAGLITLRKICNHPDLSTGGPQIFRGEDVPDEPEYQFGHYKRSGKMIVVEALLRLWHKQEHRVLLFTQSKAMLNILEKLVQDEGYTYLTMDGSTSISARQPLISQFNNDRSIYLLLMTTRVGGLGVNLTGANRVIIYDPDWNPSTDIQARERAWRIGQKRQVTIYRLLTAGTIEEKIYHRQIFKQFLTNRVLKDPKQRRLFKSQDMLELFTLGSKDNQEGTETSALFAGTGSDVKIPKKLQKNRFDEIQDRKMKEREEEEMVDKVENRKKRRKSDDIEEREKGEEVGFDTEELERMKEFARQLSRKIEMEKKQREGETVKQTESLSEEMSKESVKALTSPGESKAEKDESVESLRKEDQNVGSEKEANVKPDIEDVKGTKSEKSSEVAPSVKTSSSSDVFSLRPSTSGSHNWKQNGKVWTIPTIKKDRKSSNAEDDGKDVQKKVKESRVHETEKEKRTSSSGKHKSSDRHHRHSETSHKKSGDEEDHSRHRKKKKRRDARFEGERIPHLVKHCPLSKSGSAETEDDGQQDKQQQQQDDQHHDDYVLRQLFKKTGIHGAMKHDKIMDCGRPDFAIVEAEAEKVAREAAAALRRSRQQCTSALSGVPTWTGHHGGVAKPRFGQKKNSLLVDKSSKGDKAAPSPGASTSQGQAPRKPSEKEEKEKLFDGSISGNISLTAKNDSLSSNDLLSRIRARKRTSATAGREDDDDMFLQPDLHQTLDPKDEELLQDIRNYVAFMATTDGQATTQEIVLNFGKRLPKSDAPKFKAMLNQICDHQGGVWRLKAEFR